MTKPIPIFERSRQMSLTTKPCSVTNCPNEILDDSEFSMCEVCRILKMRELIALGQSPDQYSAPLALRKQRHQETVTLMRQDEMVAWLANIEFNYLETQKVMKLYGIGNEKKKAFKSLSEQIEEGRDLENNRPTSKRVKILRKSHDNMVKKKETAIGKLAKRFGKTEEETKAWMDEDINL